MIPARTILITGCSTGIGWHCAIGLKKRGWRVLATARTDEDLKRLEAENRVVFRYAEGTNPNGAMNDIAGIVNAAGTVIGMMPHPENMIEPLHGKTDCRPLFESLLAA